MDNLKQEDDFSKCRVHLLGKSRTSLRRDSTNPNFRKFTLLKPNLDNLIMGNFSIPFELEDCSFDMMHPTPFFEGA